MSRPGGPRTWVVGLVGSRSRQFCRVTLGPKELNTNMKRKTSQSVQRDIQEMVRRIVRQFHPQRVILFGSHARGDAGPDSDVDLLVVISVPGSKHEKQMEIQAALRGVPVPVDVIVSTPEEFGWRQEIVGTIEYPAVREGKVLYAQS